MLSSSVRYAASTASLGAPCLLSCYAPRFAAASLSAAVCRRNRLSLGRFSSSKASSSKNRQQAPKALPARDVSSASGTGAKATNGTAEGKNGGAPEKRKRRASNKAGMERASMDAVLALPSVPNTQHLSQEGTGVRMLRSTTCGLIEISCLAVGLTNFFSIHRPISITHTIPKIITDEAFAEIFTSRTRANRPNEVMSTLSNVVDNLEGPVAKLTLSPTDEADGQAVHKVEIRHEDGSNSSMLVHAKNMGQFLPFQPPPLPVPESPENEASMDGAATSSEDGLDLQPQHRVYQAMFTIEETMDADGRVHVMAHSPEILHDGAAARQSRRLKYEDALKRRYELLAISVKRRRKHKMRKHKLKKRRKLQRKDRERLGKL
jgi:hypothetical protein